MSPQDNSLNALDNTAANHDISYGVALHSSRQSSGAGGIHGAWDQTRMVMLCAFRLLILGLVKN